MSNNKFHFEFKRRTPKIWDFFFSSRTKKKLQKIYHFYLKKNNIFLNYNRFKLLTFTQKNRKASECACSETSYI